MVAVSPVDYAYDGKISFDVSKNTLNKANIVNAGIVAASNGYVVMTARTANDLTASIVNKQGAKIEATGATQAADGSIELTTNGDVINKGEVTGTGDIALSGDQYVGTYNNVKSSNGKIDLTSSNGKVYNAGMVDAFGMSRFRQRATSFRTLSTAPLIKKKEKKEERRGFISMCG